eukprot:Skav217798  [mRNA]  locus=scaffold1782:402321:403066:- [translate_table: standard]
MSHRPRDRLAVQNPQPERLGCSFGRCLGLIGKRARWEDPGDTEALAAVLLVSSLAAPAYAAYNAMIDSKERRETTGLAWRTTLQRISCQKDLHRN